MPARMAAPSILAASALAPYASNEPSFDADRLTATVPVRDGVRLMEVMRALDAAGVDAVDIDRRQATLDDVFLTLTGQSHHGPEPDPDEAPDAPARPEAEPSDPRQEVPA